MLTEDMLAEALGRIELGPDNAATLREIADGLRCSQTLAQNKLGRAITAGLWYHAGYRDKMSICGRAVHAPVYAPVVKQTLTTQKKTSAPAMKAAKRRK